MLLTPNQIQELLEIIEKHHLIYIGTQLGQDMLTTKDKRVLKAWGVNWKNYPKIGKVDEAFVFGLLSEALGDKKAKKLNYKQLKDFIYSKNFIKLTTEEKLALHHLKIRSYSDIKNLGQKITRYVSDFITLSLDKRKSKYEKIIRESGIKTIVDRGSLQEMKSTIKNKTGDFARDIDRVVDTTMHEAYNTGRIMSIKKKKGDKAKVWHQVYQGACKHCISLYLTNGIGSEPKVFTVSELLANGSNYGKKTKDWLPVSPPVHPYCRCQTFEYFEGWDWSHENQLFEPPVKVERKRKSKAKVTIE